MESLGKRITNARKKLDMNQKELAEKCGITEATLSRYENELREPKGEVVVKIANALDVSTDYLLGRTDNRNLTVKDEKSIKNDLKKMMTDLRTGQAGPAFYGDTELDEEELDLIEDAMELALKTIKLRNKEKYTPKKYKKDK